MMDSQDSAMFFGTGNLPLSGHHPDLVSNITVNEMVNGDSLTGLFDVCISP